MKIRFIFQIDIPDGHAADIAAAVWEQIQEVSYYITLENGESYHMGPVDYYPLRRRQD